MPPRSTFSRRDLLTLTGGAITATSALSTAVAQSSNQVDLEETVPGLGGGAETVGVLYEAARGPWGVLTYYYFYLQAPSHLIEAFPLRNPRTRWAVPLEHEKAFGEILESAPMSPAQRTLLFNPDNLGVGDGLYAIFPPAEVLESLTSEARGLIYNYLARFDANPDIKNPVRIRSGSVDEWTEGTQIRPELVTKMKAMTYFKGDLMLFADFPYLISLAQSEVEARELQGHSSRVRTMLVRLDVKNSPPAQEIMPYWSTGLSLRRKKVEPLMRAAMATPGVAGLDLVHLLPPLPRKLLYTYPDVSMAVEGVLPDCHWTALNFFNYNPESVYLDEFFAASKLMAGFEQVDPPYRFGDVLVFLTEGMNAHHSCIYIAADIVYTKNGRSLYAPWTILHLRDVESTYPDFEGTPLRIQAFRREASPA